MCLCVCMRDLARLECRPEPEQNQEEEESGLAPSFMKPAHRTESPSPQMTCFYSLLLFILLLFFSFLFLLLTSAPPLSVSVVFLLISYLFVSSDVPLLLFLLHQCHAYERYGVVSLVVLTLSQLDQTTWTTHILSSFMSLPWIN